MSFYENTVHPVFSVGHKSTDCAGGGGCNEDWDYRSFLKVALGLDGDQTCMFLESEEGEIKFSANLGESESRHVSCCEGYIKQITPIMTSSDCLVLARQ